jgi:hypothetical protein
MGNPSCLCIPPNIFVFCAIRVVTKESRLLVLPRASCLYSRPMINEICHCRQTPSHTAPLSLPQSQLIRAKERERERESLCSDRSTA